MITGVNPTGQQDPLLFVGVNARTIAMFTDQELSVLLNSEYHSVTKKYQSTDYILKLRKQALWNAIPPRSGDDKDTFDSLFEAFLKKGRVEETKLRLHCKNTTVLVAPWEQGKPVTLQTLRALFGPLRTECLGGCGQ